MIDNTRVSASAGSRIGAQGDRLHDFYKGYTDSLSRTISAEDVALFARLTGDYNALHTDDEFAARTEFDQRVVHGFLHASLLSTLVGMKLPGRGALYLSQTIDFTQPVFIGDTVKAIGEVEHVDPTTRILTITTTIENQQGDIVLKGKARAKVLRTASDREETIKSSSSQIAGKLLEGRTALVTGASRGIGRAIATLFADHGAHVLINYHRSEGAANALVADLRARGGQASALNANVSKADEVVRLVEEAAARGLDIVVNNAGPKIKQGAFECLDWAHMCEANEQIVGPAFHVTQAALPILVKNKGNIVNILSTAAFGRTAHNWLPYVSAKAALFAMSKNLAQEFGPKGVRVNMVSPSLVDTDLTAEIPDRLRQMFVAQTPLRRLATTEDVANAVLFLVSPFADFITGENLMVAGGDIMP